MSTGVTLLFNILLRFGPDIYEKAVALYHKNDPSQADFLALIDESVKHSWASYVAEARADAGQTSQPGDPGVPVA